MFLEHVSILFKVFLKTLELVKEKECTLLLISSDLFRVG